MAELLTSTVEGASPEAEALIQSEAQAAAADQSVLVSEVQGSLAAFIQSLAASGVIPAGSTLAQLSETEPAIGAFVQSLQDAITQGQAATPQGLLLAQSLQLGNITQEQFESGLQSIVLTPAQIQAAVAVNLPGQTQALLLALASSANLNQLQKLISAAVTSTGPAITAIDNTTEPQPAEPAPGPPMLGPGAPTNPIDPPALTKIASAAVLAPASSTKLQTEFEDVNLSFLQNLFQVAAAIAAQNLKASASSLLSLNPQPKIMTGARAVVKLNGKVVALCTNVQYEISTDWTEIKGIDELLPNDLAPTSFSVKGSMSLFRVPNKSPVGEFLQQDMFRGMIWPYTTIEIRDKRTDELIMQVKRAAITSRSEAFTKGQLTTTNLSFIGIGFRDETIPELLPDQLTGTDEGTGGLLDAFSAISNLFS